MNRLLALLRATAVVSTSMSLGATIALSYAWFLAPGGSHVVVPASSAPAAGLPAVPVRLEAPLSRDGEATKAALFNEPAVQAVYERAAPAVVTILSSAGQRQGLGS